MIQNKRVEKEINEIVNPIKEDWKNISENNLEQLIKKFGKICKSETNNFRKEILSDYELGKTLLEIGNAYSENSKILMQLIISFSNMHSRYGLDITDEIFQFFIDQTKNKKVNFYVAAHIKLIQKFDTYPKKWEYIMSIPNIAPKKKSILTFQTLIEKYINEIPNDIKDKAKIIFETFLDKSENLHKAIVNSYLSTIKKLN